MKIISILGNIMPVPTKEETQEFISKHNSFFTTPLTPEGQKKFQQFYEDSNAIDKIADYSMKLEALLYKNKQRINKESSKAVIYAWRNGDFAPALEHKEVRQFIMDNKDHPAIVLWVNKESEMELNDSKNQTKKHEASLPLSNTLTELETKILNMSQKDFDYLFDESATQIKNGGIIISRRLVVAGIEGTLFETQEDYYEWIKEIISTQNKPIQTLKELEEKRQQLEIQQYQQSVETAISNIDATLTTLRDKIGQVNQHHFPKARVKAMELLSNLEQCKVQYRKVLLEEPRMDLKSAGEQFSRDCKAAIADAKPILEKDLSWGAYLENLGKALLNAIVWAVTLGNVNSFFAYDKAKSVEAVEEAERNLKPGTT